MKETMLEIVEKLADEIKIKYSKKLNSEIQKYPYPRDRFYASDFHKCDRYLTHTIIDYDKRPPVNEYVQALFDSGKEEEKKTRAMLEGDLNFDVIEADTIYDIKHKDTQEIISRLKIDGKIKYEGYKIPFEHKEMDSNTFSRINNVEDFKRDFRLWKYYCQMQLYLYATNNEAGLFILTDGRKHYKLLPIYLEYELCEWLVSKMERCWKLAKKKEYGNRMEYDSRICGKCPFMTLCLPDMIITEGEFIDDDELLEQLRKWVKLREVRDEWNQIDKDVKERFKGAKGTKFVGAEFMIEQKTTKKTIYDIPDEIKKKYAKLNEYMNPKIIYLGIKEEKNINKKKKQ
jgi:hypothetical protein